MILPHFTNSAGHVLVIHTVWPAVSRALSEMRDTALHDVWLVEIDDAALIDAVKNQTEDGKRLLQLILKHRLLS